MKREPVTIVNAVITIVEAGLALLVSFGMEPSGEQIGAIMTFVIAVGAVVNILLVRPQVTPVADPRDNAGNPLVAVPAAPIADIMRVPVPA